MDQAMANSEMIAAVNARSSSQVATLLDKGVGVNNIIDVFGNTALHLASTSDKMLPCVKILVERGASVNMNNAVHKRTPLHVASLRGSSEIVQFLISNNGVVNHRDKHGDTPLHLATKGSFTYKHKIVVDKLLNAGAQIQSDKCGKTALYNIWLANQKEYILYMCVTTQIEDILDDRGNTLLHYAAKDGDVGLIMHLLSRGRSINKQNLHGQTALHLAVQSEHSRDSQVIDSLIERGADVNIKDVRGDTAVVYAIQRVLDDGNSPEYLDLVIIKGVTLKNINTLDSVSGQPLLLKIVISMGEGRIKQKSGAILVEMLIKSGADVNAVDEQGNSALHKAVEYNNKAIVQKLLRTKGIDVDLRNRSGFTALASAVEYDIDDIAFLFVGQTRQTDSVSLVSGDMLLHKAVKSKLTNYFQQLVPLTTDLHRKNSDRTSALHLAALRSYQIGVHTILANEFNALSKDYKGRDLFLAILRRDKELLVDVLAQVSDVNCKDAMGRTPLHWAVLRGFSFGVGCLLICPEIDVNVQDTTGSTALHYASLVNKTVIIRLLLSKGAHVNILDEDKRSALHLASFALVENNIPNYVSCEHLTVESLCGSGSLPDLKDCDGNTPLHLAMKHDNFPAVASLLNWGAKPNIKNNSDELCFSYNFRTDSLRASYSLINYFTTEIKAKIPIGDNYRDKQFLYEVVRCYRHLIKKEFYTNSHEALLEMCTFEVTEMLQSYVGDLCLHDVLFMNPSSYIFNSELKSAIYSTYVRDNLPIYGRMLRNNFKKGELRQRRLNDSVGAHVFAIVSDGSEVHLPAEVKFMIFSFLSDEDLESIIRASY